MEELSWLLGDIMWAHQLVLLLVRVRKSIWFIRYMVMSGLFGDSQSRMVMPRRLMRMDLAKGRRQRIVTVEKNFRWVNIFHSLFGAVRLLEYILFIMEQIA